MGLLSRVKERGREEEERGKCLGLPKMPTANARSVKETANAGLTTRSHVEINLCIGPQAQDTKLLKHSYIIPYDSYLLDSKNSGCNLQIFFLYVECKGSFSIP